MPSPQSESLSTLYRGWGERMAKDPGMSLDAFRAMFDEWESVTSEPDGVAFREDVIGDLPVIWCEPADIDAGRLIICLHGGGYMTSSRHTHRKMFGHIAREAHANAIVPEYGRAPENPHPGPVNDALSIYKWALNQGYQAAQIALVGDSAGGGLSAATVLAARAAGLPTPGAVVLMSAWLDLHARGDSYDSNAAHDLIVARPIILSLVASLLGEGGRVDDPLANPMQGDLSGFPPLLAQAGGHECLLDDSRAFVDKARAAGVDAVLEIEPHMQHVFQFMAGAAPEADAAIARSGAWLRERLA